MESLSAPQWIKVITLMRFQMSAVLHCKVKYQFFCQAAVIVLFVFVVNTVNSAK